MMETSSPGKSVQPRRSCLICASAKVKCVQTKDTSGPQCDRCRRLNKTCVMQPAVPRKPRTRKKTTRVAQLEQKLDGLVHLLTTKENQQAGYPSPESFTNTTSIRSPPVVGTNGLVDGTNELVDGTSADPFSPSTTTRHGLGSSFLSLSSAAAQEYLEKFQTKMTPNFPFVVVPAGVTADMLRQEKPALFGAIIVAASFKNMREHTAFGEDLLRYLSEELLFKGVKNLDLLQALIVYSAWYHGILHFKRRMTQLISLMTALATDLGLGRASSVNERLTITIEETKGSYGCGMQRGVRTLDERRAYIGVFFISSTVSATHRDINALKRSAYQDECCTTLENAAEYPTDRFLVYLARLQAMVERIAHTFQYGSKEHTSVHQRWRIPLTLYTTPLERDLVDLKNTWPQDLPQYKVLMLHYYSARAYLFEISLYEPIQDTYFGQPGFRRMEFLYVCLQAIKSFYEVLFSIPIEQYYFMPLFNWTQVTHSLMTLSKLCFLDAEDWDVAHARQEVNFSPLLEQVSSRFEESSAAQNTEPVPRGANNDIFLGLAQRLRIIKQKYDKRVAAESALSVQSPPTTYPVGPNMFDDAATMDMIFQLEDDAFWQELMGGSWPMPLLEPEA